MWKGFENRFLKLSNNDGKKCKKFICLETGWENKNKLLSSKISNLIQLLVSVITHCSQTFSVDFQEFLLERRHLKKNAEKNHKEWEI